MVAVPKHQAIFESLLSMVVSLEKVPNPEFYISRLKWINFYMSRLGAEGEYDLIY